MGKIRCYLAGAFVPFERYADWRDFVKERLSDLADKIEFYDPRTDTRQGSIATFVYQDLVKGVEGSDMVFYFVTNSGDVGSAIECERAECRNKLVILCINERVNFIHSFLLGIPRRVIIGIDAGLDYLRNLAELGLDNEFEVIYRLMKGS